jgi:hypothetical protein
MRRTVVTCFVGLGIILAGAVQTTLHQRLQVKQVAKNAAVRP